MYKSVGMELSLGASGELKQAKEVIRLVPNLLTILVNPIVGFAKQHTYLGMCKWCKW